MKLVSVQEMISIEQAADAAGHTYPAMMEAAGSGLADKILARFINRESKQITALIGSGNNGGDALVALEYLSKENWRVTAILCRQRPEGDHLLERYRASGGRVLDWTSGQVDFDTLDSELKSGALILDAIFGTGIRLPLREPIRSLLEEIKKALLVQDKKPYLIAVDCPSGMDCDSGAVDPACLAADLTVTMAAVKQGCLKYPAYDSLGELELVEIGLPAGLPAYEEIPREIITPTWVGENLPERPSFAHKGSFGTCLVIGGSSQYPGAPLLAGEAAYRSGAGLVNVGIPGLIYLGLIGSLPEATWVRLNDRDGSITASDLEGLSPNLDKATSCLIGPGMGLASEAGEFLEVALAVENLPPLVLDADALRLLTQIEEWSKILPAGTVLTPHPGEMSALTGMSTAGIQEDRVALAEQFAREWDVVLVLKGAHTVIADPSGQTLVNIGANPALARAGSGDVLAGLIAGFLAQGLSSFQAAGVGVWLHSQAGAKAAEIAGCSASVLAGDLNRAIGMVFPH